MITLPDNFKAELEEGENIPAVIVHVQEDILAAEETLEVDWTANTSESNVDYTTTSGDVSLVSKNDQWTTRTPGGVVRAQHGAITHGNEMYVFGGSNFGGRLNTMYKYTPGTDSWASVTYGNTPPSARGGFITGYISGKMYIHGGQDAVGGLSETWEFDVSTLNWTLKTSSGPTRHFAAGAVHDGKLYQLRGFTGSPSTFYNDVQVYDPVGNSWTVLTSGGPLMQHSTANAIGDKIYVMGGFNLGGFDDETWEYDITGDSWTQKANLPSTSYASTSEIFGGLLYHWGGRDSVGAYHVNMWAYSPSSNQWSILSANVAGREFSKSAILNKGNYLAMYIHGGINTTVKQDLYEYGLSFLSSGHIQTQTMDLGSTPTVPGEWQFSDSTIDDSTITYEAWADDGPTPFTGGETPLGTVADGETIIVLKEYYRVKATLFASTNLAETSILHAILLDFSTYRTYTDCKRIAQENNYRMGLTGVSALSSTINDFKESTHGQVSITLDFGEEISKFLHSKYPKNKIVKVLIGFDSPDVAVSDFIDYFHGNIVDYSISGKDIVTLTTQSFQVEFKKKAPTKWEDVTDDITWIDVHPVDVMHELSTDYSDVRDSKIVLSSFNEVKAALPGWTVTRTITKQPEEVKKLQEELRLLTSTYLMPRSDGKVKLKRFDAAEETIATLTDGNTISLSSKGNLKELRNKVYAYHDWDGDGTDAGDFGVLGADFSQSSIDNWGETAVKEIKDKWSPAAQAPQIASMMSTIISRYKNPPAIINAETGLGFIYVETADMVNVTTRRAPSTDGVSGITDKKFQVVSRNLNFKNRKINMILLEV